MGHTYRSIWKLFYEFKFKVNYSNTNQKKENQNHVKILKNQLIHL